MLFEIDSNIKNKLITLVHVLNFVRNDEYNIYLKTMDIFFLQFLYFQSRKNALILNFECDKIRKICCNLKTNNHLNLHQIFIL